MVLPHSVILCKNTEGEKYLWEIKITVSKEKIISNDSQLSEGSNNQQHNKKPKWLNKKNITIILTLLVVIIAGIFLFIRSSNAYGAKTQQEVSQKFLEAIEKEDYLKASDYVYYKSKEERENIRNDLKKEYKKDGEINWTKGEYSYLHLILKDTKINEIIEQEGREPYALLKDKPDSNRDRPTRRLMLKKVDNRWYVNLEYDNKPKKAK